MSDALGVPERIALESKDSQLQARIDTSELTPRVIAPSPTAALPDVLYDGASTLVLTPEENAACAECEDVPDEDIQVRPDGGYIYVGHEWARRQLTRIFGRGQWALRHVSDFAPKTGEPDWFYQAWVLIIRGHFVGSAVGCVRWTPTNSRTNYGDAAKIAESDALSRIVSTSSLQIGVNVRDKQFAKRWRREHCVLVKVRTRRGIEEWWRRKDDDPFEGEIQDKQTSRAAIGADTVPPLAAPPLVRPGDSHPGAGDAGGNPPPPAMPGTGASAASIPSAAPEPALTDNLPAESPASGYVTDARLRLFWARARRAKLIEGTDVANAIARVGMLANMPVPNMPGRKMDEILVAMLRRCNHEQFEAILESLGGK